MLTRRAKAYSSYWTTTVNNDFYGGTALWCPRAQVSLNLKKSRLGPPKSMFNAENFTRSLSMSYLNWFRRNSLLKCVSQPEIAKKILKKTYFGVQSNSSSLNLFLYSNCQSISSHFIAVDSWSVDRKWRSQKITENPLFCKFRVFQSHQHQSYQCWYNWKAHH